MLDQLNEQLNRSPLAVTFAGGVSGFVYRFLAYTFLRWIPGRQGPILVPVFFALTTLAHIINFRSTPSLSLQNGASSQHLPTTPGAPSYAAVAAASPSKEAATELQVAKADDVVPAPRTRKATSRISLSSLLFGAPSPNSPKLNAFSLLVNFVLLLAVLDSLWSPILGMEDLGLAYARVGAVDHHSAKIAARIPPLESMLGANATVEEWWGAKVAVRPTKPLGKWSVGAELRVVEDKDWTGVAKIGGLWASTEYEYRLLLPSLSSTHHPSFPKIQTFTTAPDPSLSSALAPNAGTHYTFASTSCVKPGFPYTGPFNNKVVKGAQYLKDEAEKEGLKFLMFLGDYIYADTPYWPGAKESSYHKRYRQTFASPEMKALVETLPMINMYDDHEVFNDFSSSESDPRFAPANSAFHHYLGEANYDPSIPGANYFDFQYGDSAFFVWDTRRYRSENFEVDDESKTMLGDQQKEVFFDWLAKVNQTVTWKFIVSSTPLMTLWSHGDDTWAGFVTEREAVLDIMQYVPNVIVLSGDRHEFAAASIRTTITEFSTSPLNQFYLPIRTLSQSNGRGAIGEDVLLNYLPDGNSKFSTFEVDTRDAAHPVVRVKVIIDGKEAWRVDVQGTQLEIPPPPKALGSLGKSLMELLGFQARKWF